jgi:hypothetical protein
MGQQSSGDPWDCVHVDDHGGHIPALKIGAQKVIMLIDKLRFRVTHSFVARGTLRGAVRDTPEELCNFDFFGVFEKDGYGRLGRLQAPMTQRAN